MDERFAQMPKALADHARTERLAVSTTPFDDGGVPALLAHPDDAWWTPGASPTPLPVVIWMHGRTVSKELDPGRYLRWQRAGLATCAIDLPGHGDRFDETKQGADSTLEILEQCVEEIDLVIDALGDERFNGAFDTDRLALGGMSAGGMVALVRLTRPHRFRCATVESAAGNFRPLEGRPFFIPGRVERTNPIDHLDGWAPIPLQALHSRSDTWVPVAAMETFIEALRRHYFRHGVNPNRVEWVTWPKTGAPEEHAGFGRFGADAKATQLLFLEENLSD